MLLLLASGYVLVASVSNTLNAELQTQIIEETKFLKDIYQQNGITGLTQALQQVSSSERLVDAFDDNGLSLTGRIKNLPSIHVNQQFFTFSDKQFSHQNYLTYRLKLNKTTLIVGRGNNIIHIAKQRLILGFIIAGLIFIITALFIGYWFSRRSANKLKQFEHTLTEIANGNLSARLPVAEPMQQIDMVACKINTELHRLQQLVHSVQNTSKAIAHDLKTPLSRSQIALLSALDCCDNNQDPAGYVQQALDENIHLNELFETLLRISRLQTQPTNTATFSTFAIAPILTEIIDFLTPNAELNGQTLHFECDTNLHATADKTMIQQAVMNLINNAIIHSGKHTTIKVTAKKSADNLIISVCDTGKGIDKSDYDKVLEPFYRLDSSRSTSGNGLGLALVQAIAEYHQGKLELGENEPQGLCVSLVLAYSD
ncbi:MULTISPECIES: HAMP domain-containing sensor histidine kinase [Pasteurellaceae]|uniref:histidine kinase n=1 Tax=Pasteurella atlantica TaxID=2827233 RepID=A0AAW8CJQ0_9PAST|nr:HAMP domain-containing sensor histidine kinase [Pasteurella atlantica]MBR0572627.1 HAMP domain-containing histidine kinase [Pasteurella atlantica]MDP8038573.1 HAMP domain-containing sensor histidine kinase [Pasteurella atlantica]MDP8040665.1 HAMP domain-containing sensor histidine kinase [Pasteurella atlantica]MDP8042800.1 HAMP domain-containing sensor histidine kinase [Pasteurella atlantica]MDP8044887.1 HAMP domain-containing sensor histidine kinase [Pasteurella atlantica]